MVTANSAALGKTVRSFTSSPQPRTSPSTSHTSTTPLIHERLST